MYLSDWILTSAMTISEGINHDLSKIPTASHPPPHPPIWKSFQVQYTQHDCTVKSTPVVSLCILHSDTAVAADKHYLVCDHVRSATLPYLPPSLSK